MEEQIIVNEISIKEKERWNRLLYASIEPSYRQSIEYNQSKKLNNRKTSTYIFSKEGNDIAGVHYSVKGRVWSLLKTADITSGIIFKSLPEETLIQYILAHFEHWAIVNNASIIRITPWIAQKIDGKVQLTANLYDSLLRKNCYLPLDSGSDTYWIDLSKPEDQILMSMKGSTRSKIRKAEKSKIELDIIDDSSNSILNDFWNLYYGLGKRKNFGLLSEHRFKAEVKSLMNSGIANLYILKYNHVVINMALASNFGHAMYFHGAINQEYKNLDGCPAPGHYAQWVIIKYLKSKGIPIYDMAFCPGAIPDKSHPKFDMWHFKYSFGGMHIKFMPVYGKVLKPLKGKIISYLIYRR